MACAALNLGCLLDTNKFALGGHRGCGENLLSGSRVEPAWRENSVKSFQHAAELGVSFIEFDVQVTSDAVPVIWHDDQVYTEAQPGTTPRVCEVKDLTLQQFQGLVCKQELALVTAGSQVAAEGYLEWTTPVVRKFRSKVTRQAGTGYAPWTCAQDDALPTLQDVFQNLPPSIGFDIEVKMTLGDDVERTPPEEVQRVVGPILDTVKQCTSDSPPRTIVFSSFDPDVCIALSKQQSEFPVMFLSGCGLYEHVDPRRTSIQTALDMATDNKLAGIVIPTSILMKNQWLVKEAASKGLLVLTYGLDNDDPACVTLQHELGVHAAIVDDVEGVLPIITNS